MHRGSIIYQFPQRQQSTDFGSHSVTHRTVRVWTQQVTETGDILMLALGSTGNRRKSYGQDQNMERRVCWPSGGRDSPIPLFPSPHICDVTLTLWPLPEAFITFRSYGYLPHIIMAGFTDSLEYMEHVKKKKVGGTRKKRKD